MFPLLRHAAFDGKVRQEHVASLGSISLPLTVAGRMDFWAHSAGPPFSGDQQGVAIAMCFLTRGRNKASELVDREVAIVRSLNKVVDRASNVIVQDFDQHRRTIILESFAHAFENGRFMLFHVDFYEIHARPIQLGEYAVQTRDRKQKLRQVHIPLEARGQTTQNKYARSWCRIRFPIPSKLLAAVCNARILKELRNSMQCLR